MNNGLFFLLTINNLLTRNTIDLYLLCVSYCMVCVSVQKDNQLSLALDYRPYRCKTIQLFAYCIGTHLHFMHCEIFDVNYWNINER